MPKKPVKKVFKNKSTIKKKPKKPKGGGPNRNPDPKNGMGSRKLRP